MQGKGSAIEAGVSTTIFPPIKWVSWSLIELQKAQAVLLAFGLQDHGSCWVKVQTCSFTSQGLDVLIHKAISTWFIVGKNSVCKYIEIDLGQGQTQREHGADVDEVKYIFVC